MNFHEHDPTYEAPGWLLLISVEYDAITYGKPALPPDTE